MPGTWDGGATRDVERWAAALPRGVVDGVGVEAWSLCVSESRRIALGVKDTEAGNPHAPLTLGQGCGARYLVVWRDGLVSRGHFERRQLADDPAATLPGVRAAAYADPDAARVSGPTEMPAVALHDASAAAIAAGASAPLGARLDAVRSRVAASGMRTWSGSFSATESCVRVLTSAGLDAREDTTAWGWFVTFNGEIGTGFGARAPEPEADFAARLARLADTAEGLDAPGTPLPAGVQPLILHPRVVEEYVLGTLFQHLDGSTVHHGEGRFRAADFAARARVLRADLALRLDPLVPLRAGSYRFTAEGVPAARCSFIEDGRLVQPVLDLKHARRLGLPPTPLPQALDAVVLDGATPLDLDAATREAGEGALVLSVLGVHTQDSASGDFSLAAPQALRIESGVLGGRVRATLSGNLFEVLDDPALRLVRFEGEHTPGLLFPCRIDRR